MLVLTRSIGKGVNLTLVPRPIRSIAVYKAKDDVDRALKALSSLERLNDGKRLAIDRNLIRETRATLQDLRKQLPVTDKGEIVHN
jgi:hypothetical protein